MAAELQSRPVHVNVFLDSVLNDPCPPVLMWLPLLHRMANVEHGRLVSFTFWQYPQNGVLVT